MRPSLTHSCVSLLLLSSVLLAAGCGEPTTTGPSRPPSAPITPITPITPATPTPQPPTITGPAVLYQRISPQLSYGSADAYLLSLGPDSAFTIIFPIGTESAGWSGRYARAGSLLAFLFKAWSAAGPLEAGGTVRGDTLFLRYNTLMQLTGFEDGVYLESRR